MDEAILRALNSTAEVPFIAALALVFSSRWVVPIVCTPIGLLLLRKRRWFAMASIALAMGASDSIASRLVKPAFDRVRPCRALTGLVQPSGCGPGESFPSTHATNAFAFLLTAAPVLRFGWPILAPLVVAVAGSRVVLGVHYPSDVAGGAALGSIVGGACWLGRRKAEGSIRRTNPHPSTSP